MKKILLAALLALTGAAGVHAQGYPAKQITVIVPFAAGGATDVLARFLGERIRAILGQPIIIENVTGAGGSIGVGRLVRAPADGYTIEIGTSTTNMLLGALYPLQFDLLTDLAPVIQIASEPLMIVGKKNLPAKDLKELIAWLKANPDKASIGIPAVGGTGHLAGLSFLKQIGASAQFVPYRGNGPALQDLVAGQIDLQIEPASNFYAQAKAGAIKPFAITSKEKVGAAGDIPTTAEAGMPGFVALVRHVGAQGHTEGHRDQAQRGDARGADPRRDA
jgi:tripartite-type tricarboxylate transporter receptor subunit TctC